MLDIGESDIAQQVQLTAQFCASQRILKERRPSKTCVDNGRKFFNKDFQKLVELNSTENEDKSCANEIFKRTIKEKMCKYLSANNTRKFVEVLDFGFSTIIQYIHQ